MPKEILLTQEGLEKLKGELRKLKEVDRKEVISRIKTAKEFGDLSENSEYDDAKNEQAFVEGRIQELEATIKYSKIVEHKNNGDISVGSVVEVEVEGDKETLIIAGQTESDPINGKISSDSPVARALIGKKKGEAVDITTPNGKVKYKIISVK